MYRYPGTYVVVAEGEYGRHQAIGLHEITVVPARYSLVRTATGDVQIHNDAQYDGNLSGYRLVGQKTFVFPKHSVIKAGSSITIPGTTVGVAGPAMLALYDAEDTVVASVVPPLLAQRAAAETPQPQVSTISRSVINTPPAPQVSEAAPEPEPEVIVVGEEALTQEAIVIQATEGGVPGRYLWGYALIGLTVLIILALYTRRI